MYIYYRPICDINNQSETNLDTEANIEPMTPNLLTNTTISEINVSNVENNCFNNVSIMLYILSIDIIDINLI